jgi:hypothetical protein
MQYYLKLTHSAAHVEGIRQVTIKGSDSPFLEVTVQCGWWLGSGGCQLRRLRGGRTKMPSVSVKAMVERRRIAPDATAGNHVDSRSPSGRELLNRVRRRAITCFPSNAAE